MSLTVHDYPRSTNLFVNFAQTVHHDHTPANFSAPNKEVRIETILAIHLCPTLHSAFPYDEAPIEPESRPASV